MPVEAAKGGWETATQYGVLGVVCFFAIAGLIWFVISQKQDLKESNTKVITLLETTVRDCTAEIKDSTAAKRELAQTNRELSLAFRSVKCAAASNCDNFKEHQ